MCVSLTPPPCETQEINEVVCPYKALSLNLLTYSWIWGPSLMAQMVKNLPAMQETQVWSLGWEDPLEKGIATHSSILAWKNSWTEEPGGL